MRRFGFAGLGGGLVGLAFLLRYVRRGEWKGWVWLLAVGIVLLIVSAWYINLRRKRGACLAHVRAHGDYQLVMGVALLGSEPPIRAIQMLVERTPEAVMAVGPKGIDIWSIDRKVSLPSAVMRWREIVDIQLAAAHYAGVGRIAAVVDTLSGQFAFFVTAGAGIMPASASATTERLRELDELRRQFNP